ncbi:MAG: hypothetical protein AABY15_06150 [Nanoarchaeota archaeon]
MKDFEQKEIRDFPSIIRKTYKVRNINNTNMFPSDPSGSLDVFHSKNYSFLSNHLLKVASIWIKLNESDFII